MLNLVETPEDRFSHVAAQLMFDIQEEVAVFDMTEKWLPGMLNYYQNHKPYLNIDVDWVVLMNVTLPLNFHN